MAEKQKLFSLVVMFGVVGVLVGGSVSHAESRQCLQAVNPSSECLTQEPWIKTLEGMGAGLFAGTGAALGATWQAWQKR
jgi:hypothetical protein